MTRHRFGFPSVCCGQTACSVTDLQKESGDKSPQSKNQQAGRGNSRPELVSTECGTAYLLATINEVS